MADADVPWWMRGAHPSDDPDDGGTVAPTKRSWRGDPADDAGDAGDAAPSAPKVTPPELLPGDRVVCVTCGLPARALPDGVLQLLRSTDPVLGECAGTGEGHGPWATATSPITGGGDLLAAMRRSGGPHGTHQ